MIWPRFEIIDISQPVSSRTACFPGDVPFSRQVTVDYAQSGVINLCAMTLSPHVGTHADAPVHVRGNVKQPGAGTEAIGEVPLSPYIGPAAVVDVAPHTGAITWPLVAQQVTALEEAFNRLPARMLFKTAKTIFYDVFEAQYAWFAPELVRELAARGVVLMGIDTPSVDAVDSKTLETHHTLLEAGMAWLENLDFTGLTVDPQHPKTYFLIAPPLKLMEMEASPLRAVLLSPPAF